MENHEERRRYFRVDDNCILALTKLTKPQKADGIQDLNSGGEIAFPDSHRLYMSLESDLFELVNKFKKTHPEFAKAIELLNRKINVLAKGATLSENRHSILDQKPEMVNLSACGLACNRPEPIIEGTDLKLEIVLLPTNTYILTFGQVVNCDPDDMGYRIGVEFDCIRDEDLERLIQHIMRKESELLKSKRQQTPI